MISLITIIILLACVALTFFVLVQNPKGGGLTGTFGNIGSQVMGVKQSTDAMEKGTWTAMGIIAALCIVSVIFFDSPKGNFQNEKPSSSAPAQQSPTQAPAGGQQQPQGK